VFTPARRDAGATPAPSAAGDSAGAPKPAGSGAPRRRRRRAPAQHTEGTEAGDGSRLLCFCAKHAALAPPPPFSALFQHRAAAAPLQQPAASRQTSGALSLLRGAPGPQEPEAAHAAGQLQQGAQQGQGQGQQQQQGHQQQQQQADGAALDAALVHPHGAGRCRPYSHLSRRGSRAPEAEAAALLKRLFMRATPYVVTGRRQQPALPCPLVRCRPPLRRCACPPGCAPHAARAPCAPGS
jgi:hypothetical protein